MSKQQSPANPTLEQILADLEQKFGVTSSDEKAPKESSRKKSVTKLSRQTLLSLVALVVIVAGAAASFLLVRQSQEIRQRAQVPYSCGGSSDSRCSGKDPGATCDTIGQNTHRCSILNPSELPDVCSCVPASDFTSCTNGYCTVGQTTCAGGFEFKVNECGGSGGCCPVTTNSFCNSLTSESECDGKNVGEVCAGGNRCMRVGTTGCNCDQDPGATCFDTPGQNCYLAAGGASCELLGLAPGIGTCNGTGVCCGAEAPTATPKVGCDFCSSSTQGTSCNGSWIYVGNPEYPNFCNSTPYCQCPANPTKTPVAGQPTATPGTGGPTNTPRPSNTPTKTPTRVPSATPTRTPTRQPSATPTRVPSITPGPQCVSITMGTLPDRGGNPPLTGDTVGFECGAIAGASSYQFRLRLPSGQIITLAAAANNSRQSTLYVIQQSGTHTAQCRGCSGTGGDTCQEWEQL